MSAQDLKNAATGKVALSPVAAFSGVLEKMKPQIALALPKHMNADRMARLALTAFSTTPALQRCSTQSILGSLMVAVQLGLEPGINGQGYLIPYKETCTFVPGWKGLVDLVSRSGRATVWTGVVFAGDDFEYQLGDAPYCRHRPGDHLDGEGQFTHVYAIGRVKDAQMPVIEVWSRAKVEKHLKQYNKVGNGHYAKSNENNFEMYARKVALLQVLKYMPSSIELANAMTASNAAEEGKGVVIEGDFVSVVQPDPEERVDQSTGEITSPAKDNGQAVQDAAAKPAKGKATGPTYAELHDQLKKATSAETAALVLDTGRDLPDDQRKDLAAYFAERFPDS